MADVVPIFTLGPISPLRVTREQGDSFLRPPVWLGAQAGICPRVLGSWRQVLSSVRMDPSHPDMQQSPQWRRSELQSEHPFACCSLPRQILGSPGDFVSSLTSLTNYFPD